jgi:acylphosphatase
MAQTAKNIIFHGHVQGVGFRFTAHRIAIRYDLTGWVRNLANGNVELFVQGSTEDIDDCVRDIQDSFAGYISETQIETNQTDPRSTDFKITF